MRNQHALFIYYTMQYRISSYYSTFIITIRRAVLLVLTHTPARLENIYVVMRETDKCGNHTCYVNHVKMYIHV